MIRDCTASNYTAGRILTPDSESPNEKYRRFTAIDDAGRSPMLGLVLRETLWVYCCRY